MITESITTSAGAHIGVETLLSFVSAIAAIAAVVVSIVVFADSKKPDIIAYLKFDFDHRALFFIVENVGKGVAKEITITGFDTAVVKKELREKFDSSFVIRGIPMLVPGDKRGAIINCGSIEEPDYIDEKISVSYKYKWYIFNKKKTAQFSLDYYSFFGSLYVRSELREIRSWVERTSRAVKGISRAMNCVAGSCDRMADQQQESSGSEC